MTPIGKNDAFQLLGQINLNHLLYFWAVGQTGSMTAAAARLGVSQPSVSEQVQTLERRLGAKLLDRSVRGAALTPAGEAAMRYAEEVVGVCAELVRSLPLTPSARSRPLVVGTADAVPKPIVCSVLRPAMVSNGGSGVICREWRVDHLLSELSMHRLDLVISDSAPELPQTSAIRSFVAYSSPTALYAVPKLARRLRRGFPGSLEGAPIALPAAGSSLRVSLDRWMALHGVRMRTVAETEDRALLHYFAQLGEGVIPVATITAGTIAKRFDLERIANLQNVQEQYFVLLVNREREHPDIQRIRECVGQLA
ncbi:MAG TPA: LysR family transcriptional regulator [Phycisphaerales bacterium]|nr:LysR family transcriptional regulator [Phycisphaerales bacterium]